MEPAPRDHLKKRPSVAPPILLASPLALNAFVARFDAWLNLSQLKKAVVLVTVRRVAMTAYINSIIIV